jgi:hypothetical protein
MDLQDISVGYYKIKPSTYWFTIFYAIVVGIFIGGVISINIIK